MNAHERFNSIRNQVLSCIHSSNYPSITLKSPSCISGIYMLYIDDFSDERIIPFYIGKSIDLRKRFRQHIDDIKRINSYSHADYHGLFLWGAWGRRCSFDGHYKACKMFKYLVEHHCSLQSIKMLLLEECTLDKQSFLEQEYISTYRPDFFGFNQINSITLQWENKNNPEKQRAIEKEDAELFNLYWGYGFTEFNYLHSFINSKYNTYRESLNEKAKSFIGVDASSMLSKVISAHELYLDLFEQAKPRMIELFSTSIHELFLAYDLKSKRREMEVISLLLNNYISHYVSHSNYSGYFNVVDTKEYLEYYMNRNRKCKECGTKLKELFSSRLDEIRLINAPVIEAYKEYEATRKESLEKSRYSLIFPNTTYANHPLGEN